MSEARPTLLCLYNGGYWFDEPRPQFQHLARRGGFKTVVADWRWVRVRQGKVELARGFEVLDRGRLRPIRTWETVRPSAVLHRKCMEDASAALVSAISRTEGSPLVSYHPMYAWTDSKWRSELCFRAGEAAGRKVNRPKTYLFDAHDLHESVREAGARAPLIIKPAGGSQGFGMWFSNPKTFAGVAAKLSQSRWRWWVAQELIQDQALFDGRRCDMRIYLLVKSWDPLDLSVIRDAVSRVAARPYDPFDPARTLQVVTNWSFNHKQGISTVNVHSRQLLDRFAGEGVDVSRWWPKTEALLREVFLCLRDHGNPGGGHTLSRSFYLTGVDVAPQIVNGALEPVFIEHNYAPALHHPHPGVRRWFGLIHRQWAAELAALCEGGDSPRAPVRPRAVVALVDLDPSPASRRTPHRRALRRAAWAMAGRGDEAFIVPWTQVSLDERGATISGPAVRGGDGQDVDLAWPRRVDALFMHPAAGAGRPIRKEERAALERLRAAGVDTRGLDRHAAVSRLLQAASRRGVPSNAAGAEGLWGAKDALELDLRAYQRATGERVPRPETLLANGEQARLALGRFKRLGLDAIVKPAGRARGEGVLLCPAAGAEPKSLEPVPLVIQELAREPLLVGGLKTDVRCYLLVDTARPEASRRVGPVLLRSASAAYTRGVPEAEVTNTSFRARRGLPPKIRALESEKGLSPEDARALAAAVEESCARLIAARAWTSRRALPHRAGARVLLWGVDLFIGRRDGGWAAQVLEVNPYPQLFRGDQACDHLVGLMLRDALMPALLAAR